MQVLRLVQSHSMLCAYASLSLCHLLEYCLVVPFHVVVFSDDIDVDVTVSDVSVAEHFFAWFSEMVSQGHPLLYVETYVVGQNFTFVSGKDCHVFPHFPYFLELYIVPRKDRILNLDSFLWNSLEKILKSLTWWLNKQQMIPFVHILKDIRMEVFLNHHVSISLHVLKSV